MYLKFIVNYNFINNKQILKFTFKAYLPLLYIILSIFILTLKINNTKNKAHIYIVCSKIKKV